MQQQSVVRSHSSRSVAGIYAQLFLLACLLVPTWAYAAGLPSTYPGCQTRNVTVAWGGTVPVNMSTCHFFGLGTLRPDFFPSHGTATPGPQPVNIYNYQHNGSTPAGGGTDVFHVLDDNSDFIIVTVTIQPPSSPITVLPASLPVLRAGELVSQALSSSGGLAPYTYTLQSGTLPLGLSLSGGVISGTPTQRGPYSFTVRSRDATTPTAQFTDKGYSGNVLPSPMSLVPASGTAIQNVAISQPLNIVGGLAPHSCLLESGSFPSGISVTSGCVITGTTAAAPGNFPVTIRVTDASTGPGSYFELESFTLVVSPPPSVSIAVSPASVSEDGVANLTYTVTRSLNLSAATTVNITTGGTATSGTDYTGGVATVVIPANATTATITIDPSADTTGEPDETVTLSVATGTGYTVGSQNSATGTITNDDFPDLTVAKVANGSFQQGGSASFTVTVTNSGVAPTTAAYTMTDAMPTGLTAGTVTSPDSGWNCTASTATNVSCTRSTALAAGASTTLNIPVNIAGNAPASVTNTASISGGGEQNTGNNSGSVPVNVLPAPQANLAITKTDGLTSVPVGSTATYTIVASNAGPNAAPASTVIDNFPARCSNVSWTCVGAGGGTCAASGTGNINQPVSLPVGGSVTFTAACTVSGGSAGSLGNTATVSGGSVMDPSLGNNSATDNTSIVCGVAPVSNGLGSGPGSLRQAIIDACTGDTITFAPGVTVVNGNGFVIDKNLTIDGGQGVTLNGGFANRVMSVNSSRTVNLIGLTIRGGNIGSADRGSAILNAGNLTLTNCTVSDNRTATTAAAAIFTSGPLTLVSTTVSQNTSASEPAGLEISGSPTVLLRNSIVALNVAAIGPRDISGTVDPSSSFNLIGTGGSGGLSNGVNGNQVGVNPLLGPLALNGGGTAPTHALLPGSPAINAGTNVGAPTVDQRGIARPQQGTVDIGAFESQGFALALGAGNNQSTIASTAFAAPLTVNVAPVAPGEPVNGGRVTFTPPGSGASSTIAGNPATISGGVATTGTVTANATAGGPYTVAASAAGAASAVNFSLTNLPASADLSITKTNGTTNSTPGGSTTYTIVASNAGPAGVTGATVADTFPAGLTCTWTCAGTGGGTCAANGAGNINESVNLPSGGAVTFTAACAISAAASGTLSNTATVSSAVTDPVPGNNSASDTDTLVPSANLAITKTNGTTSSTPGGTTTYTIVASNAGPSNVASATVADTFPASLSCTWTCVGAGGGTCTASGSGNINDSVNLPSGASTTYTATCAINAGATGTLSNTVTVASAIDDPSPANNSATDMDTLSPQADLSITKTDGQASVNAGTTTVYTITASNAGPSNVPSATVADTFPAFCVSPVWSCVGAGGGICAPAGSGNISQSVNLPAGGSVSFSASCPISSAATGTLSNTATVSAGVTDPTPGNNSATDTSTIVAVPVLSINSVGLTEGDSGSSVLQFEVARSTTGTTFSVDYATANGTAIAGSDYTTTTGTLNFAAGGGSTQTINVPITGDNRVEGSETFTLTLSNPTGTAQIGPNGTGTGTITDNDSATVQFNPTTVSQAEGTSPMVFTVTLTNPVQSGVTLTVNTTPGTATAADFTAITNGTVSFAPNSTTAQTVNVIIANDSLFEGNETYTLALSGLTATGNVTLPAGTATATGTINNDDVAPTITINAPSVIEGNVGSAAMNFLVSLNTASGLPVNYNFATGTGTATAGVDFSPYAITAGSIPAGSTGATIQVAIFGDTLSEANETVVLEMSAISNANVTSLSSTGTIIDDDQQPTTTEITSDNPDPSPVNTPYTVAVTVRGASSSPTGTVTVDDGTGASCGPVALVAGTSPASTASCAITSTTPGTKTLTATYTPSNTAFGASTDTEPHTVIVVAPTLAYAPTPGTTVTYTGVTTTGTTGTATIALTPSGGAGTGAAATTSVGNCVFGGADAASFALGAVTLPLAFEGTTTTVRNLPLTCTASDVARSATLSCDETRGTAAATPRSWPLSCPAGTPLADLGITGSVSPNPVNAGTNLTYVLTATNAGPSVAQAVQVSLPLPTGTGYVSVTQTGATCTTPAAGAAGTVTCTWAGATTVGQARTLTVVASVPASSANGTVLAATATTTSSTPDPATPNNSLPLSTTVATASTLAPTLTATPSPVVAGTNVTWTASATKAGPSDAQGVQLSLPLPATTRYVSATASTGGTCTTPAVGATGTVTCTWAGATAPTTVRSVDVVAQVQASATGTLAATVSASSTTNPTPVTASSSTPITSTANLQLGLTASPTSVNANGGVITYVATATNTGPSDAPALTITIPFPIELGVTSAVASAGGTCSGTSTVTCTWPGATAPGESRTATITAAVQVSASRTLFVTASANSGSTVTAATATTGVNIAAPIPVDDPRALLLMFAAMLLMGGAATRRMRAGT